KTATSNARKETARPTLICCKTIIGWGAPNKRDSAGIHGAALGDEEIAAARAELGWADSTRFAIPDALYAGWDKRASGAQQEQDWQERFEAYAASHPDAAAEFERRMAGRLPDAWAGLADDIIKQAQQAAQDTATRKSSKAVLEALAAQLPELLGGSADLSGSNGTDFSGHQPISADNYSGNYVYYGVREFAMSAISNGLSLHGGFVPFTATFLTFSDYARNAVRMAALMGAHNVFVYTHDSIGLGEDGPTHQAVEHLASLRLIPSLHVWRPADAVEVAVAWRAAIERRDGPAALALTRQNVTHNPRSAEQIAAIARGGYVLHEPDAPVQAIAIATGSEVELAMAAATQLAADGIGVRVVSMPCVEVFLAQDAAWQEQVLPAAISARVAVEAGVSDGWWRLVGCHGRVIGVDRFGLSAPAADVYAAMGVTATAVAAALRELLG